MNQKTIIGGLELLLGPDRENVSSPSPKTMGDSLCAAERNDGRWVTLSWGMCNYITATPCDEEGFMVGSRAKITSHSAGGDLAGWQGASDEHPLHGAVSCEQRNQPAKAPQPAGARQRAGICGPAVRDRPRSCGVHKGYSSSSRLASACTVPLPECELIFARLPEVQMGSLDFHHRISGVPLPVQEVILIFSAFAMKETQWMDRYAWEKVPLKEIDFKKAPDSAQWFSSRAGILGDA
ncbi:MAG: hypothetical protein PHV34_02635 [Verrucomicrobiae bacterium]|nr:hypothetical protein [Verrucomicrobiae bacterium]